MNFKKTLLGLMAILLVQTSFALASSLLNDAIPNDTILKAQSNDQQSNWTLSESNFSLSTDFVSTHIWRGLTSGSAPCIEPFVQWSKGGLKLSGWTSIATDNSYREIDVFATYQWKFIELGIFDYYCPSNDGSMNDFSRFDRKGTQHLFEAQAVFYGSKKYPFKLTTACFIGGCDLDDNGEQRYSSYLELAYPLKIKDVNLDFELGMTPFEGMYASSASVFNYGFSISKRIKLGDKWEIPTKYKLVYNAEKKDLYFIFSFTLS